MKTVFTTLSVIFGVIFSHSVLAQDVTIYYTNDIHAHVNPAKIIAVDKNRLIGGMANIAGIVNEAKKKSKDVFFFDAGDYFTGPYISTLTKGEAIIDIMNTMPFDAVSVGNHEFDHGVPNMVSQLSKAEFPILLGNIYYTDTNKPVWDHPWTIIEKDGLKIGVIGLHGAFAFYDTVAAKAREGVEARDEIKYLNKALAELKGYANTIPNMHILINAVTINEAKDSSAIENIVTTHDDIYKVLTESGYKEENAKEVVDYRNAIWTGHEQIKKDGFISTNTLVKIQGTIEHNRAGIRKLPGTELKNSVTGKTIYTPPQDEKEIRNYLKNLKDFINNNDDGIDPLIKVCLIHYQFESIHPFYDGNGRTGRILNILYLVLNNLIDSPILYLSKYINKTKQEYYKLFNEVR